MRRLTTELCAIPVIVLLFAAPTVARTHRNRGPVVAIQPTDSSSHLVLLSRSGWARVKSDRGRSRVSLRPEETLTGIAETGAGWVACGVRRSEIDGSPGFDGSAGFETSVFLLDSTGHNGTRLPTLEQREALQLRPVLLIHQGQLAGVAWLEGESQRTMAVRFAEWTGVDWGPTQTVSRPGPGSQTGLSGVTLRGGDILLAWSRYDGSDDEIVWSLRNGSAWSSPARIGANNRTPDITPVLASSGRGATLVWGRMDDGEYRLLAREFRSGKWQRERAVAPHGSVFPTLTRSDGKLLVIYRTARRLGWAVTDLDGDSPVLRQAWLEDTGDLRPVLARLTPAGPILQWTRPGRSAALRWNAIR